ncbi:hypothetical protein ACFE04_009967 [Oxalis oulophora]
MAKPRKQKNNEEPPKQENSGAVVRHQKLCLSIDIDKRIVYGYTELEIVVPEIGFVGLHADNLVIESVLVDGEPAEFEYYPTHLNLRHEHRWSNSVSSPSSAADFATAVYLSAIDREMDKNLLINCCKPFGGLMEQLDHMTLENGVQSSSETKQNVKLVRINYWAEKADKAETGIHFDGKVLHVANQIRRARCWFPCIDDNSQRCRYDLEFTVANDLVAVSVGSLLYQVLSKDDPPRKTYVYKLEIPVSAQWISLAVGPFEVLPDQHISVISHMCMPVDLSKLRNTIDFFHNAYSHYEDYLGANFPFGSYKQIFLAPEMAISSSSLGAAVCIFSSQLLFDEKVIDQTIDTYIKLAFALARQWFGVYITPDSPNDEWLLDGLAGFLTDTYIKKVLGNNEARYRRYKANCAVCKADDSGVTSLSSSPSCKDLHGTNCIGFYGKVRSWKSVAILHMLEKQMGPESFRKILQTIIFRAQDANSSGRSLSTKEFRHCANKVGNLERPFLKEFFLRWVGACGCPLLRMGFSFKRKNIVELAVFRECTASPDSNSSVVNSNPDSENRDGDTGWPGMMSIRIYEIDGIHDHPVLPMAGETWQLLEIHCHSKLTTRRYQKPRKGTKADGSDDNGDSVPPAEMRTGVESPLLWIRADPEMEYLAEIHLNQPVLMWINQLEKDGDVVAQAQAVAALEALPQLSFPVVNALNNFLSDSKAFWRVRIKAAFAMANTASEENDWAGLHHLMKFYKSRRFDADINLPKPNDFQDFAEYFVLEAIPHAIAMVRASDKKSPHEAVEFVLQLLKYNDNNGNKYSDVFWLAALVQSVGELEFGQQSILLLSSLLKRIDRLLQFDRLMPSYNGILTTSCIQTLTQIALKLSGFICLDHVFDLIKPFRNLKTLWQVRIEASKALLSIELHCKGIDASLMLFIKYVEEEPSLRGQVKLGVHAMRLCQIRAGSDSKDDIKNETLLALLRLLEGRIVFNNEFLRHHLFCIFQILAGRNPTLYGVPRDIKLLVADTDIFSEQRSIYGPPPIMTDMKPPEPAGDIANFPHGMDLSNFSHNGFGLVGIVAPMEEVHNHLENDRFNPTVIFSEAPLEADTIPNVYEQKMPDIIPEASTERATLPDVCDQTPVIPEASKEADIQERIIPIVIPEASNEADGQERIMPIVIPETSKEADGRERIMPIVISETSKEVDTVSNSHERKGRVVKIKVRRSAVAANSRAEEKTDNRTIERSLGGGPHHETDRGAASSVSVDAPSQRKNSAEALSISNHHNLEEVNSCHDRGSRMTASIGSVKFASEGDNFGKELQCTADSSRALDHLQVDDPSSPSTMQDNNVDAGAQKFASLQTLSVPKPEPDNEASGKEKDKKKDKDKKDKRKKDKEKKRKHDENKSHNGDPEYWERKRLKKEKRRKEKELAKLLSQKETKPSMVIVPKKEEGNIKVIATPAPQLKLKSMEAEPSRSIPLIPKAEPSIETTSQGTVPNQTPRFKIKIKNRTLNLNPSS